MTTLPLLSPTLAGGAGGEDVNLYLYVANGRQRDPLTVAYFTGCGLYDFTTNRPTVGMFNFCSASFDSNLDDQLSTLVHEVVHILVGGGVGCVKEVGSVGVHLPHQGVIRDKVGAETLQAGLCACDDAY